MISFTVPGRQVSTNQAYRSGRGRFWMNPEGKAWKAAIGVCASNAMRGKGGPITDPVGVHVDIHFDSARPDLDGPLKLLLDSLMPHVIRDDRQVVGLFVRKFVDREAPRTVVQVIPLGSPSQG